MSSNKSNRQFSSALEALAWLQPEIEAQHARTELESRLTPVSLAPSFDNVLDKVAPMPREALFIGVLPMDKCL